jgi:hypothetical protein
MTRLACRVDNYVQMVLDCDAGTHETMKTHVPQRPVELGPTQRARLLEARASLKAFLWTNVTKVLRRWHLKLVKEFAGTNDESILDRNVKYICNLEAHVLLCARNASLAELDEAKVTSITRGVIFLATRHQWNRELLDQIVKERQMKATGQVDTVAPSGRLAGVEFFLEGEMTSLSASTSRAQTDYMVVRFQLTNATTGLVVWSNSWEVKKEGSWGVMYQ